MSRFGVFYELLGKMPGATKEEIVYQYSGGTSLSELYERSPKKYRQMIEDMRRLTVNESDFHRADRHRKRVIAAIAGYFDKAGLYQNIGRRERTEKILGTACRAAGVEGFNAMTESQMKRVYNEFVRKQKTAQRVEAICHEARAETNGKTIRRGCLSVTLPG